MAYFDCIVGGSGKGNTLVVTCADDLAGATITCANGTKTYTKTCPSTSPYEVTFYGLEAGTYTVSATVSGNTYTTTVVITDYGAELGGFNWKTWVDLSKNYTSSDFTDLDDLLSDETAIRELMTIHACVDYLAGIAATSADVEKIIENDYCAKWINLRDYALDTLYANEIIAGYMDTADKYFYGEWALMPQVPTMTSNTAPYGEASATSVYNSNYQAYRAFRNKWDGTGGSGNCWQSAENQNTNQRISYKFSNPVCVKSFAIMNETSSNCAPKTVKLQGSHDGTNWVDISDAITCDITASKRTVYTVENEDSYLYIGLLCLTNNGGVVIAINTLQFYAWAPKGNVPVMTSNTAPYGTVSADGNVSGRDPYKCFDGYGISDPSHMWNKNATSGYVQYEFTNPTKANMISIMAAGAGTGSRCKDFEVRASNDGFSTYETLLSETIPNEIGAPTLHTYSFTNDDYYKAYRLYIATTWESGGGSGATVGLRHLQFYGRELSVSVPKMATNTTPYGEVVYSSQFDPTSYAAYKAFANDNFFSTPDNSITNQYIGYRFTNPVNVKKVFLTNRSNLLANSAKNIYVEYSNDGTNWSRASEQLTNPNSAVTTCFETNTDVLALYWRIFILDNYGGTQINVVQLQFYGLDYSEKEFETGTTKKWLYDHGVELEEMTPLTSGNSSNVVEKKDNEVYMYKVGTNSAAGIYSPLIDLSDYSLLRAKMGDKSYSSNSGEVSAAMLCISSSTPVDAANMSNVTSYSDYYNSATQGNLPNNLSLDTSSYNEGKYLSFVARSAGNFTKYSTCTELWLE